MVLKFTEMVIIITKMVPKQKLKIPKMVPQEKNNVYNFDT